MHDENQSSGGGYHHHSHHGGGVEWAFIVGSKSFTKVAGFILMFIVFADLFGCSLW